jgi:hypothetical protein
MTVSELNDRITRVLAAVLGIGIVVAVVLMARSAGGHGGVLPASLRFTADQAGALAVSPASPSFVLEDAHLRPGRHAEGDLALRNQTGARLAVRLRANPSSTALDGIARVRITTDNGTIFDSTLGALREGTEGSVRVNPGTATTVRLEAWIPATEQTGYEGRRVEVALVPVERTGQ